MSTIETHKSDVSNEFNDLGAYIRYCKELSPRHKNADKLELLDVKVLNDKIDNNAFDKEILEDFDHMINVTHQNNITLLGNAKPFYSRLLLARRLIDKLYKKLEVLTYEFRQKEIGLKSEIQRLKSENINLYNNLNELSKRNNSDRIELASEKENFLKEVEKLQQEKELLAKNKEDFDKKVEECKYNCTVTDSYIDDLVKRILAKGVLEPDYEEGEDLDKNDVKGPETANAQDQPKNTSKKLDILELLKNLQSPTKGEQTGLPTQAIPDPNFTRPQFPQPICYTMPMMTMPMMTMPIYCCKKNGEDCCHH